MSSGTPGPNGATRPAHNGRLESWKEIAAYLNREIRTVQRWEKNEDLPVRRLRHEKRDSVYALPAELDRWCEQRRAALESQPAPVIAPAPRKRRGLWLLVAAILLMVGGYSWFAWSHSHPPRAPAETGAKHELGRVLARATEEHGNFIAIALPERPTAAAISEDGNRLYVTTVGPAAGLLNVIDTTTNRVISTMTIGHSPRALARSPDGRALYVATADAGVQVVDLSSFKIASIPLEMQAVDLALTPDGRWLYAALEKGGLSRIDTRSRAVYAVPITSCPAGLAIPPDGQQLYVNYQCGGPGGRSGHDTIDVYALPGEQLIGSVSGLANVGSAVVAAPNGTQVWAVGGDACIRADYDHVGCPAVPSGIVHVLRAADRRLLRTVAFADAPGNLSFVPDSSRVVLSGGKVAHVVDTAQFREVESAVFADDFGPVIFSSDRRRAYVLRSASVSVLGLSPMACVPAPGGRAFWPGDGTPNDVLGSYHGKLGDGVGFAPGRVGQAFSFAGPAAHLEVPFLDESSVDFTLSAWVKFQGGSGVETSIVTQSDLRTPGYGWRLAKTADDSVVFCVGDGGSSCTAARNQAVRSSTRVQPGVWYFVAVSKTADELRMSVNGATEKVTRIPHDTHLGHPGRLRFGAGAEHQRALYGLLDEIQFNVPALPAVAIREMYEAGARGECQHYRP